MVSFITLPSEVHIYSEHLKPRGIAGMSKCSLNEFLEVGAETGGLNSIAEEPKKNGPQWNLLGVL